MSSKVKIKRPLWLNWEGRGYFAVPAEPVIPFPGAPLADPAISWVSAYQHARRGDFRYVLEIPQLLEAEDMLYDPCTDLVGDAGPSGVFAQIIAFLAQDHWNFELAYAWSGAVAARGRLGDIPVLVNAYEANINSVNDDNDIILMHVAQVIDDGDVPRLSGLDRFRDLAHYRAAVTARCQDLAQRFGGEDVLLWRGAPTSVRRMAQHLVELGHAEHKYLPSWTRHRFEASTGINCKAMFDRHGDFRPLQAAAIGEAFLDSPDAARYRDGVRYFFGHEVP